VTGGSGLIHGELLGRGSARGATLARSRADVIVGSEYDGAGDMGRRVGRAVLVGGVALIVCLAATLAGFRWQAHARETRTRVDAAPSGGRFVRGGDVEVFVQELGPPAGPVVLFVHGMGPGARSGGRLSCPRPRPGSGPWPWICPRSATPSARRAGPTVASTRAGASWGCWTRWAS